MGTPTDPSPPQDDAVQVPRTVLPVGLIVALVLSAFVAGWLAHAHFAARPEHTQEGVTALPGPATRTPGGEARPVPPPKPKEPPLPAPDELLAEFDEKKAMEHVQVLAVDIGGRFGGTDGERKAADHVAEALADCGYKVSRQEDIPLPPVSRKTQNVIAVKPGKGKWSDEVIVVGGHMDSIDRGGGSPGANDNGSGIGVILEMARVLADYPLPYTIQFVGFGSEEMVDGTFEHHHYGSRHYCKTYKAGRHPGGRVIGMLSVDMIAVGENLHLINMRRAPMTLYEICRRSADALDIDVISSRDDRGCSDHEPFEKMGIPVAWFERKHDPDYHTARDRYENLNLGQMKLMGRYALHVLLHMTDEDLEDLSRVAPPLPDTVVADKQ